MMTVRERIKAVVNFRKPDVLPWTEDFVLELVLRWIEEGLPVKKLALIDMPMSTGGTGFNVTPTLMGLDPGSYFGCTNLYSGIISVDIGPLPRFKQALLQETDKYIDVLTELGIVSRRLKKAEFTWYNMPMWVDFPVKDRESWEEYKKRLNPNDPRRYPKDWDKEAYIKSVEAYQGGNTILRIPGFYGFGARLMGIAAFNVMFYKDPELIHDMAQYWEYFVTEAEREAVETLKDRIDIVYWWEDMAERHGPCISPKSYREFLLPHYKRVTSFLRKNKIDRIMVDCDGNFNALLDLMLEAGFSGLEPLEVNSGMNALEIRKKYGERFFLVGNLDKTELIKGGEAMRREVDSKVPILKETGGYLPSMDHAVPVDFTLNGFKEYSDYIKKCLPY
jgi:hypothetical protein